MDGFEGLAAVAAVIAFAGAIVAAVLVRPHEREDRADGVVQELAA